MKPRKRHSTAMARNPMGRRAPFSRENSQCPTGCRDTREQEISLLLRELKSHPHKSDLRTYIAVALWRTGKETEAIGILHDGLRLQPQDATVAHCLGMLYAEKEQYESAKEWFHQALQWDDQHVESYYYLGLTYAAQQHFDSAFVHLQKAAQLRPGDTSIREALHVAGQCMQRQAVSIPKHSLSLVGPLSGYSIHTPVDTLADMIIEETDYVPTLLNNTTAHQEPSELTLLLEALDRATQRYPDHADLWYYRGVVWDRLGQIPRAIRSIRQSLRINPHYKESLIYLGILYQQADRHAKAIRAFHRAIEADAAYADVYLLLGQSYQKNDQIDSARNAYEHALLINQQYRAAKEALAALAA